MTKYEYVNKISVNANIFASITLFSCENEREIENSTVIAI